MPERRVEGGWIVLEGKVLTSLGAIRERLDGLQNLERTSYGTVLRYRMFDAEERGAQSATIELSSSSISACFFASVETPASRASAIIKLLSLLAVLSRDYEVGMRDIYNPVIEALHSLMLPKTTTGSERRMERLEFQVRELAAANNNIAARLLESRERLAVAETECEFYKGVCSSVVSHVSNVSSGRDTARRNLIDIGVSEESILRLASIPKEKGRKP